MDWWRKWRENARRRRAAAAALDELFRAHPELLALGRLGAHHRRRVNILEVETSADGEVESILFGIIRHPKAHPLATRGEEVLELLLYCPRRRSLELVGGGNLTRRRRTS